MKHRNAENTGSARITKFLKCFGFVILVSMLGVLPGCKKTQDTVSGSWRGTLTIDLAHQHEAYQNWTEEIINADETITRIEHSEHVTWSFTDTVVIEFQFDIQPPLYEARIEGQGTAKQTAQYISPTQCSVAGMNAPDFNISVFGVVNNTTFTFNVVPKTTPTFAVAQQCTNVEIQLPVYGTTLLGVISNISMTVPTIDGITSGGSGTVNPGSGYAPLAYVYNFTLNKN